jgi:hypothetical protein
MQTQHRTSATRVLRRNLAAGLVAVAMTAAGAAPAAADFCIQLTGGSFSDDIGFFRFKGSMPSDDGAIETLKGRAAGLSPVFGTAVVADDGSFVELAATFFIDAVQGQFDIAFSPPDSKKGAGGASLGEYGLGDAVKAKVVSCSKEP